jgi:hypothetical protein
MVSPLDLQIIDLWKTISPALAYTIGFDECAGKLFIPTDAHIEEVKRRIGRLRRRAHNELQRKTLDSMEVALEFDEPAPVLDDVTNAVFDHLVKDGPKSRNLLPLLNDGQAVLEACIKRYQNRSVPIAVEILALYRIDGLTKILDSLLDTTSAGDVQKKCKELKVRVSALASILQVEGFGKGTFEEVERVFDKSIFDLGRKRFYIKAVRMAYGYHERPQELEAKGTAWLEEELPKLRAVTRELAKIYGCEDDVDSVVAHMDKRTKILPSELIETSAELRSVIQHLVDENIVRVNPKYVTRVIETPAYLSAILPTAFVIFFDTFKNPYQMHLMTTDSARDPVKSVPQLINLLVHEEYGHCLHHSNSAMHFGGSPSAIELIYTSIQIPVTEGLAFNREREFMEVVKELESRGQASLNRSERAYAKMAKRFGGIHLLNLEIEFQTRRNRVIRFLRVIGDVWMNTGRHGLLEFLDWAHAKTGESRRHMFYQIFPAHEGMFPGYATTYAIVGEEIGSIENTLKDKGARICFSTYLTGIGYVPRRLYRKRLERFAKGLTSGKTVAPSRARRS